MSSSPPAPRVAKTKLAPAWGWHWGKDGKGKTEREIRAESGDRGLSEVINFSGTVKLRVSARPVVFVHGLASNAAGWAGYTKQDGYLAAMGLRGFAVGDGQAEGEMSLGDPSQPLKRTKTIAQNAEEIARYVGGVKRATGAQTVDLVAHGMGGLVSRYYIERLMGDRDVAQLILLGPPYGGTGCANLPASLGIYLPATLELRPAYLSEVFSRQNTRRQTFPSILLAGAPISEPLKAPCAAPAERPGSEPSERGRHRGADLRVAASPSRPDRIGAKLQRLRRAAPAKPAKTGRRFPDEPAPAPPTSSATPEQFTKVFTGHVNAGGSREVVFYLDKLSAAVLLLYGRPARLRYSSQREWQCHQPYPLDVDGFVEGKDPAALFTLSCGFIKLASGGIGSHLAGDRAYAWKRRRLRVRGQSRRRRGAPGAGRSNGRRPVNRSRSLALWNSQDALWPGRPFRP